MKKNVARHTSQKLGSPSARQPRQSLRGDQEVFSSSRACVTYAIFKFTVQLCMTYASVFVRGVWGIWTARRTRVEQYGPRGIPIPFYRAGRALE